MDAQLYWYIARAGGLTAWWLLSATTIWGLLMTTRMLGARSSAARLQDLHRFLAGLSLVFLGLHLVALLSDRWVQIGLVEVLIPFTSSYRPVAVAWGVIALYVLIAIEVTSLLRARIPHRWWRAVHTSAFALFVLTTLHAVTAGTDRGTVRITAFVVAAAVGFLTLYRLLTLRWPGTPAPGSATPTPATGPATPTMAPVPPTAPTPAGPTPAPAGTEPLDRVVEVAAARKIADGVIALDLTDPRGEMLPAWEPGAHVDLRLPSGLVRQYSLCGDPATRRSYQLAISHVDGGDGSQVDGGDGSAEAHALTIGQRVSIAGPRNNFPLVLAERYLFIAGGIGITAIMPMLRAVVAAGHPWRLVYGGRSLTQMAFVDEVTSYDADRVQLVTADTGAIPDLAAAVAGSGLDTAIYACGPEPMLTALEQLVDSQFPDRHLHTERFAAARPPLPRAAGAAPDTEFKVELRRSGQILTVPPERTLLDVLSDAVPNLAASCRQGFCGTCVLPVLDGIPDHRDTILKPSERDRRDVIYPCVSRAQSATLTLDL